MSDKLWMHVDMDSYFASCEQQANPFLQGKPIAVCGNPHGGAVDSARKKEGTRSVIAAASKEAKEYGVESGMPPFKGRKLCPGLLLVGADRAKYRHITKKFLNIFYQYSPKIELYSIDEAFLELKNKKLGYQEARNVACRLKAQVKEKLGGQITCSCGIGANPYLAKTASEIKKPDGVFVITSFNKEKVLKSLSLGDLCGVGSKTEKRLNRMGIESVEGLARTPLANLNAEFGVAGYRLQRIARGEAVRLLPAGGLGVDDDKNKDTTPKSLSKSKTLPKNIHKMRDIKHVAAKLAESLAYKLRKKKLAGYAVSLSIRFSDFESFSRQKKLDIGLTDEAKVAAQALSLLSESDLRKPVRKVGVGVGELCEDLQASLFSFDRKRKKVLKTKDDINELFGSQTLASLRAC